MYFPQPNFRATFRVAAIKLRITPYFKYRVLYCDFVTVDRVLPVVVDVLQLRRLLLVVVQQIRVYLVIHQLHILYSSPVRTYCSSTVRCTLHHFEQRSLKASGSSRERLIVIHLHSPHSVTYSTARRFDFGLFVG
jgi:hypothetical protein